MQLALPYKKKTIHRLLSNGCGKITLIPIRFATALAGFINNETGPGNTGGDVQCFNTNWPVIAIGRAGLFQHHRLAGINVAIAGGVIHYIPPGTMIWQQLALWQL